MISLVTKRNGEVVPFDTDKFNRWAEYATEVGGNWSDIAFETYKKLTDKISTIDIHQTMIDVCIDKETLEYSRVASRLEFATIRKNMKYVFGVDDRDSLKDILQAYEDFGVWDSDYIPPYNPVWEDWYNEIKQTRLEYWQVKQFTDKYACKINDVVIETPHLAYFGISVALFGDTQKAFDFMKALVKGKINLPTPALNGLRNGDWDTISCCVISACDSTESIGVANHIAYRMTAKKAGIGIEYTLRTKHSPVKGGRVAHLGLSPIYKALNGEVKCLCYDDKTEVLTKNGFKLFKDLTKEDLVAQVTHDRKMEFVKPSEYVSLPFKGDMYHFHKKGVSVRVTDNHQMAHRTVKYDDRRVQTSEGYLFERADKFKPRRTTVWDFGGELDGSYTTLTALDRLRIAYQADGTLRENQTTESSYLFGFKKERKAERLEKILLELGLDQHTEKNNSAGFSKIKRPTSAGEYTFIRIKKSEFNLTKDLNWVYERDWSEKAAREFFEEVSHWDGDFSRKGNQLCCFNTSQKEVADAVQYVASVSNKRSSLKLYGSCYRVYVFDEDSVTGEATNIDVEHYDGIVYCVTVPTHILVVRRDGHTVVCGNTQITRGGNATVTVQCINPEIMDVFNWKSQLTDFETRIDKLDYSFAFNDAFFSAVVTDTDWYMFSLSDAPKLYDLFYTADVDAYNKAVEKLLKTDTKHKKVKAREMLKAFLTIRQETGRFYAINVSRANKHTPFLDTIRQSNLC